MVKNTAEFTAALANIGETEPFLLVPASHPLAGTITNLLADVIEAHEATKRATPDERAATAERISDVRALAMRMARYPKRKEWTP